MGRQRRVASSSEPGVPAKRSRELPRHSPGWSGTGQCSRRTSNARHVPYRCCRLHRPHGSPMIHDDTFPLPHSPHAPHALSPSRAHPQMLLLLLPLYPAATGPQPSSAFAPRDRVAGVASQSAAMALAASAAVAAVLTLGRPRGLLHAVPWLPSAATCAGRTAAWLLGTLPPAAGGAGSTAGAAAAAAVAAAWRGGGGVEGGDVLMRGLSAGDASLRTLLLTLAPVAVEQVGGAGGAEDRAGVTGSGWRVDRRRLGADEGLTSRRHQVPRQRRSLRRRP